MKEVFVVGDNIFSPLGSTTSENIEALLSARSGVSLQRHFMGSADDVFASVFTGEQFHENGHDTGLTRFESMLVNSMERALKSAEVDITDPRTILVIASTKGNISLLEQSKSGSEEAKAFAIPVSAKKIADCFGHPGKPFVVSNACVSGIAALLVAKRLIQSGKADHAVVAGADEITRFVQSGFASFQALSPEICKPFDKERKGINLGEAAATIILSKDRGARRPSICLAGGSISNDANHLSGPSRTGEELAMAIGKALREADVRPEQIKFVSAHGTATLYNDEMEAKALNLSGLADTPVNSLKGYFGHTLGAAGLLESVVTLWGMSENTILPTYGFKFADPSVKLKVPKEITHTSIDHALKIGSGFGGCNAALVFSKYFMD